MTEVVLELLQRSDPANLTLLGVVWWRLNRRLRRLEASLGLRDDAEG